MSLYLRLMLGVFSSANDIHLVLVVICSPARASIASLIYQYQEYEYCLLTVIKTIAGFPCWIVLKLKY